MKLKANLTPEDGDLGRMLDILGSAWRNDGRDPKQYEQLVELLKIETMKLTNEGFQQGRLFEQRNPQFP